MNPFGPYEEKFAGDRTSQADMMQGMEQASQISKGEDIRFGPDSPLAYKAPDSMLDLLKSASGFVSTGVDYLGTLDRNNIEEYEADMQQFLNDAETGKLEEYQLKGKNGEILGTDWEAVTKEVRKRNTNFKDNTWLFTKKGNLSGEMLRFKSEAASVQQWGGNVQLFWAKHFEDMVAKGFAAEDIADEFDKWVDGLDDVQLQNSLRKWKVDTTNRLSRTVEAENFSMMELQLDELTQGILFEIGETGRYDGQPLPTLRGEDGRLSDEWRLSMTRLIVDALGDGNAHGYDSEFLLDQIENNPKGKFSTSILKRINKIDDNIAATTVNQRQQELAVGLTTMVNSSFSEPITSPLHNKILEDIKLLRDPKMAVSMLNNWMDNFIDQNGVDALNNAWAVRKDIELSDLTTKQWLEANGSSSMLPGRVFSPKFKRLVEFDHEGLDALYNGPLAKDFREVIEYVGLDTISEDPINTMDHYIKGRLNEKIKRGGTNPRGTTYPTPGNPGPPVGGVNPLPNVINGKVPSPTLKQDREMTAQYGLGAVVRTSSYTPEFINNVAVTPYLLSSLKRAGMSPDIEERIKKEYLNKGTYDTPENREIIKEQMDMLFTPPEEGSGEETNRQWQMFRTRYIKGISGTGANASWANGVPNELADEFGKTIEYTLGQLEVGNNLSDTEWENFFLVTDFIEGMEIGAARNNLISSFNEQSELFIKTLDYTTDPRVMGIDDTSRLSHRNAIRGTVAAYKMFERDTTLFGKLLSMPQTEDSYSQARDLYQQSGLPGVLPSSLEEFRETIKDPLNAYVASWLERQVWFDDWADGGSALRTSRRANNDVVSQIRTEMRNNPGLKQLDKLVVARILSLSGAGLPIDADLVTQAVKDISENHFFPHLVMGSDGNLDWRKGANDVKVGGKVKNISQIDTRGYEDGPNIAENLRVQYENQSVTEFSVDELRTHMDFRAGAFPEELRGKVASAVMKQIPIIDQAYLLEGSLGMQMGDVDRLTFLLYQTYKKDPENFASALTQLNANGTIDLWDGGRVITYDNGGSGQVAMLGIPVADTNKRPVNLMFNASLGRNRPGARVPHNRLHHGYMRLAGDGSYTGSNRMATLDTDRIGTFERDMGYLPIISGHLPSLTAGGNRSFINYRGEEYAALTSIPIGMRSSFSSNTDRVSSSHPLLRDPQIRTSMMEQLGYDSEEDFSKAVNRMQARNELFVSTRSSGGLTGDEQRELDYLERRFKGSTVTRGGLRLDKQGNRIDMSRLRELRGIKAETGQQRDITPFNHALNMAVIAKKRTQDTGKKTTAVEVMEYEAVSPTVDGLGVPVFNGDWTLNYFSNWMWGESVTPRRDWNKWKEAYHRLVFEAPGEIADALISVPGRIQKGLGEVAGMPTPLTPQEKLDEKIKAGDFKKEFEEEMLDEIGLTYELPKEQYLRQGIGVPISNEAMYSHLYDNMADFSSETQQGPWWAFGGETGDKLNSLHEATVKLNPLGFNNTTTRAALDPNFVSQLVNQSPEEFWEYYEFYITKATVAMAGDESLSEEERMAASWQYFDDFEKASKLKEEYTRFYDSLDEDEKHGLFITGVDGVEDLFQLHLLHGMPSALFMPSDPRNSLRFPQGDTNHIAIDNIQSQIASSFSPELIDLLSRMKLSTKGIEANPQSYSGFNGIIPKVVDEEKERVLQDVLTRGLHSWPQLFNDSHVLPGGSTPAGKLMNIPILMEAFKASTSDFHDNYFYWTSRGYESPNDVFNYHIKTIIAREIGFPKHLNKEYYLKKYRGDKSLQQLIGESSRLKEQKKAIEKGPEEKPKGMFEVFQEAIEKKQTENPKAGTGGTGGILGMIGAAAMGSVNQTVLEETASFTMHHEGFKTRSYTLDGNRVIGVGHNLSAPASPKIIREVFGGKISHGDLVSGNRVLTEKEVEKLFAHDLQSKLDDAHRMFGEEKFNGFPRDLQRILIDGIFMGAHKSGHTTIKAIRNGDWAKAADNINRGSYGVVWDKGQGQFVQKRNPEKRYDPSTPYVYTKHYADALAYEENLKRRGKAPTERGTLFRYNEWERVLRDLAAAQN